MHNYIITPNELSTNADAYYNENNCSLLGQEFIEETIPKIMDVIVPDKFTNNKAVNPKTNLFKLAKRHTFEVAKLFKVDLSTIHNWTKKGILKPYYKGNKVYFLKSEVKLN